MFYFVVIDAAGKPPSNILGPNLNWVGSYEECLSIKATEQTGPFNGMYCSAYLSIASQVTEKGILLYLSYEHVDRERETEKD